MCVRVLRKIEVCSLSIFLVFNPILLSTDIMLTIRSLNLCNLHNCNFVLFAQHLPISFIALPLVVTVYSLLCVYFFRFHIYVRLWRIFLPMFGYCNWHNSLQDHPCPGSLSILEAEVRSVSQELPLATFDLSWVF